MSNLKIASVLIGETGEFKKIDVELEDDKHTPQGKAVLFIKKGYGLEDKFENLIKLLIKPTK